MRAGRLRQRVILQSKTEARDAYGAAIISWSDESVVWGAIEPLSGKEYLAQDSIQSEAKVRIVIRYYSGVATTWRVKHGGLFYDIKDVMNLDTRNRQMTLMCSEGVTEDTGSDVSNYLLLEDGFQLLLESSGSLLLES